MSTSLFWSDWGTANRSDGIVHDDLNHLPPRPHEFADCRLSYSTARRLARPGSPSSAAFALPSSPRAASRDLRFTGFRTFDVEESVSPPVLRARSSSPVGRRGLAAAGGRRGRTSSFDRLQQREHRRGVNNVSSSSRSRTPSVGASRKSRSSKHQVTFRDHERGLEFQHFGNGLVLRKTRSASSSVELRRSSSSRRPRTPSADAAGSRSPKRRFSRERSRSPLEQRTSGDTDAQSPRGRRRDFSALRSTRTEDVKPASHTSGDGSAVAGGRSTSPSVVVLSRSPSGVNSPPARGGQRSRSSSKKGGSHEHVVVVAREAVVFSPVAKVQRHRISIKDATPTQTQWIRFRGPAAKKSNTRSSRSAGKSQQKPAAKKEKPAAKTPTAKPKDNKSASRAQAVDEEKKQATVPKVSSVDRPRQEAFRKPPPPSAGAEQSSPRSQSSSSPRLSPAPAPSVGSKTSKQSSVSVAPVEGESSVRSKSSRAGSEDALPPRAGKFHTTTQGNKSPFVDAPVVVLDGSSAPSSRLRTPSPSPVPSCVKTEKEQFPDAAPPKPSLHKTQPPVASATVPASVQEVLPLRAGTSRPSPVVVSAKAKARGPTGGGLLVSSTRRRLEGPTSVVEIKQRAGGARKDSESGAGSPLRQWSRGTTSQKPRASVASGAPVDRSSEVGFPHKTTGGGPPSNLLIHRFPKRAGWTSEAPSAPQHEEQSEVRGRWSPARLNPSPFSPNNFSPKVVQLRGVRHIDDNLSARLKTPTSENQASPGQQVSAFPPNRAGAPALLLPPSAAHPSTGAQLPSVLASPTSAGLLTAPSSNHVLAINNFFPLAGREQQNTPQKWSYPRRMSARPSPATTGSPARSSPLRTTAPPGRTLSPPRGTSNLQQQPPSSPAQTAAVRMQPVGLQFQPLNLDRANAKYRAQVRVANNGGVGLQQPGAGPPRVVSNGDPRQYYWGPDLIVLS